jgi:hypothetical protein
MPGSPIGSARGRHCPGTAPSIPAAVAAATTTITSTANAAPKVREATATASRLEQPLSLGVWPLALEWLPLGLGKWALDPVGRRGRPAHHGEPLRSPDGRYLRRHAQIPPVPRVYIARRRRRACRCRYPTHNSGGDAYRAAGCLSRRRHLSITRPRGSLAPPMAGLHADHVAGPPVHRPGAMKLLCESGFDYEPESGIGHISPTPLLVIVWLNDRRIASDLAIVAGERAYKLKRRGLVPGVGFDTYVDGFNQ